MTDTTPRYKKSASLRPGMFRKVTQEGQENPKTTASKSIYLKVKFPKGIQFEKDSGKYQTSEPSFRYSSDDSYIGAKAALRNSTPSNDNNTELPVVTSPKDFSYEAEVKVVCLDPHCTVPQAIKSLQSTYKLPQVPSIGLYDAEDKVWLDEKLQLKDIKQLPFLEFVEYRNKAEPVNMGSTKQRRKAHTLGKKTGSPFFQNWQESFKDSVKKTEDAKRREEKLSKLLDPREVNDLRDKLIGLSSPKKSPGLKDSSMHSGAESGEEMMSPQPIQRSRSTSEKVMARSSSFVEVVDHDEDSVRSHKRTNSVSKATLEGKPVLRRAASSEDLTGTEFEATRNEELLLLLQEREEEARLAAQIGQQLLSKNSELLEEIRILRDKEIQLNQMTGNYNKLESKLIKFKSRCMFLQTQLDEAKALNLLLTTQAMDVPSETTPKKKTRSELELEKQLFDKMDELELVRKDLNQKIENETKIMRKNKKLLEDNKMLGDEVDRLKDELASSKNELNTMTAVKDKLVYSETKYKMLALQVEKLSTSNVIDDEILNNSEKMLEKLTELISWSQRSQLNQENPHKEDQELLDSSVKTIQALRQTLSGNQSPEISLPGLMLSWLNVTVQKTNDVLNPESETQDDVTKLHEEAQFEMSLVYFLLALLALHRARALEMRLSQGSYTESELQSDLEDLKSKLNQEEYTNAKLSEKLSKFQNSQHKIAQQEMEMMKYMQSEAKIKEQLQAAEKAAEDLKRSNDELHKKIEQHDAEKKTLHEQIATLESAVKEKQQKIDQLTKSGSETEAKLAQQLKDREEDLSKLTQLKRALVLLRAQKEQLEQLLQKEQTERKQDKEALEKELQEKSSQIESISTQLVEKDKEIQSLTSQLKESQQEKSALQAKLTESEQKISVLTEQIQNSAKGSSDLQQEVQNLNQALEKTSASLKNSEEQNKALTSQNSELQNQISSLQQQNKQQEALCEELKKENAQVKKECEDLKKEVANFKNQCEDLKKEVASLNETLNSSNSESQLWKTQSQEVETQLRKEKQALESEVTSLKGQLSVKETEHSSMKEEISSLTARFGSAQSESEQLRNQLSAALSEKSSAQQQVSDLQSQSDELRKVLEGTKKNLEEVEGQLAEEKKEHKKTVEKYEAVVSELNDKIKNLLEKQQQYEKRIKELEQENENLRKQLKNQNETQQETQQELQKQLEIQQKEYEQRLKYAEETKKMNQSFVMLDQQTILYIEAVNDILKDDVSIAERLPIGHTDRELIESMKDGVILCKLINKAVGGTIDERVIKMNCKDLDDMSDNHNLVINSAIGIGVSIQNNLTQSDLTDGNVFRLANFIAELVEIIFMSRVNLMHHPELKEIEDASALVNLMPENILLRWFNYHLKAAKSAPITNFGPDLKDSTKLSILLSQLAPSTCFAEQGGPTVDSILTEMDMVARADIVLNEASKLNVKKVLSPKDIANGNTRVLTLFVASLFDVCSGIKITPRNENEPAVEVTTPVVIDEEGSREERAFRFWMNSLGVIAKNFPEDLADGLVLLNLFDKISPGIVNWSKVNMKPNNAYKKIENCSYAVSLAQQLSFSIVGIGGKDIFDGNRKSILSILWQMMRYNYLSILKNLTTGGTQVQEADILKWANDKVAANGKKSSISSFKDPSLKDSIFLIDLLDSMKPGRVDYSLVMRGESAEDYMLNSKYAISLARRFGVCIFLLWEDIVEVKPKMILTFIAALMSFCNGK